MKKFFTFLFAFLVSNVMFAQNHWSPVESEDYWALTSAVRIDGIQQTSTNIEVGVFYGEECRASGRIQHWSITIPNGPTLENDIVYLAVWGTDGESLTFKLYDHGSGQEMDLIAPDPIIWDKDLSYGEMEPYYIDFTTPITGYTLDITGYAGSSGNGNNWYLISSPIGEVDPWYVLGMIDPEDPDNNYGFDLFRFNQSADNEWENWKQEGDHYHFNLEPGKGYLYASGVDVTLTFVGDGYSGSGNVSLVKDDNANLAGWNLIGNPFGVAASPMRTDNETGDWVLCPFYVMNKDGDEIVVGDVTSVEPMQGIFVVAERDGETVTFTPGASTDDGNKLVINVAQNRSGVIDRAIVRFGQGNQLPKFMLNDNNTKLYIPQADNDYAVVRSDNEAELPLNFKAAANGTYILKVDANSTELDYLHLIDNKTGNDIDLLENPSYTFEANATDFANRFKLVLRNTTSIDENTNFAFYNGLDWTVNNEGKSTLQVIDMTGRIVSTETIDGTTHVTINAAPGAYMLQLTNGNDVKTQKVVIK